MMMISLDIHVENNIFLLKKGKENLQVGKETERK